MIYALILVVAVLLDQFTKYLAVIYLKGQSSVQLIDNFLYFTYVENPGAAWGILKDRRNLFIILTIVIILGLSVYLVKNRNSLSFFIKLCLVMIIAGALGNFIDRVRQGYVVDFIFSPMGGLYDFPVFNIADIYISLACISLIIYILFFEGKNHV